MSSDQAILGLYQSDQRYLAHYVQPPDAKMIIALAMQWADQQPRENYQLIVCLKGADQVIGCAGLRTATCRAGEAEVGVEIDPSHWAKGYATEVLAEIVNLAKSLALARLLAVTNEANLAAIALTQSAGFRLDQVVSPDAFLSLRLADT